MCVAGSNADPPHSAPPSKPGNITVSLPTLFGAYIPSLINVLNLASAYSCACGERFVSKSSVSNCRENGTGFVGTVCTVAAISPGTVLAGYFRVSIGNNGVP